MNAILMAFLVFVCGTLQAKVDCSPIEEIASGNILIHHMAIDSLGTWNAVWSRETDSGDVIEISQKAVGQTWSEPTVIISSESNEPNVFSIVMDAHDHLHVFWHESCSKDPLKPLNLIKTMERDSHGHWTAPTILSTHSSYFSSVETVKDPMGGVYLAWIKDEDETLLKEDILGVAEKHPGEEWKIHEMVAKGRKIAQLHMAVNAQGVVYLQWVKKWLSSSPPFIRGTHTVEKGVWSKPYSVLKCPGILWGQHEIPAQFPQIIFKPNGEPFTFFSEIADPYRNRISYSEKIGEDSWSEPIIISDNGIRAKSDTIPKVATNALGEIFTLWFTYIKKEEGFTLQGAVYSPDSGWSRSNISKNFSNLKSPWIPEILMDEMGCPIVGLAVLNEDKVVIHFLTHDFQKGWSEQGNISLDRTAKDIFADRDSTGAIFLSWIEGEINQQTIRTMTLTVEKE